MGCDIHLFIEHRKKGTERWASFTYNAVNPGRNYQIFGRLAGVRWPEEPHIEPRGRPSDASWCEDMSYWLFICEESGNGERYVKAEEAARWVLQGISEYKSDEKQYVSDPDQHTHSWLTLAEWKKAIGDLGDVNWKACTAVGETYAKHDHEVRYSFHFDN